MRTAIVTGTSSGIGLAVAIELAYSGWRVTGIDVADSARLTATAELSGVGEAVTAVTADVTDRRQVDAAVGRVLAEYGGRLDALVNNAGIRVAGPFEETPMSAIRHQFDVNLAGPMNVTRAALPGLRATEGSRLVNVSSVGGLSPLPGLAGYCGSKWALEGWTEALAHELRPLGVRVALVEPASVETGLWSAGSVYGNPDGPYSRLVRQVEVGDNDARDRAVDPITVADAVVAVVERRRGLRHPVGWSARARCAARGVVPAGLQRRLLGRLTGQEPGKPSPRHADGVILVTGCSTGFGLQIAVELARRGRRVAATMRDLDRRGRLDAVLADAEVADRVEVLAMDVTDPGSVYDVFLQVDRWEAVAGERGRLIGVVNNAGIRAVGAFEDIPPAVVDRVLETNLYGTLTVSRAAIPRLRTHGGRIVCVTSSSALAGLPAWSAYAASKWGVEGWAESMALETTPHGIDMVLVEPGAYPTDIWRDGTTFGTDDSPYVLMNEAMAEADRQAAERGGDPADVARVVARAFDARSTLIRRPVGRGAWLRWAARGVVPFGVQRWATERMLGLR